MPKRTYQPKSKKRSRKHGFLTRQAKKFSILVRRRAKKREKLSKASNRRYK
jgi:large subunit ribosomal protein L34